MPTPDGKSTKRAHYEKLHKQGIPLGWDSLKEEMEEALSVIPIQGMVQPSIEVFYKLRALKADTNPITLGELEQYIRLYQHELEPWEIDAILSYDREFRSIVI